MATFEWLRERLDWLLLNDIDCPINPVIPLTYELRFVAEFAINFVVDGSLTMDVKTDSF